MNLQGNAVVARHQLRLPPQFPGSSSFRRPWRRRNRKNTTRLPLIHSSSSNHHHLTSSSSYPPLNNLFHSVLSQLDLLTPALGLTTALALLYKSSKLINRLAIGDWSLFTSPTPFNRSVKLRCASLLLDNPNSNSNSNSNDNLVEEDGHVVSFDTGPIHLLPHHHGLAPKLLYQRMCIDTDDGGVVSLDWPAHLELTMEHSLDTTVLIVPGTTDGSMDDNVRSFVCECLSRGFFPIVMNPRGCARSPLTTPRLFTAADSDDICKTVHFINKARPWTTFMAVGFGYGANMLTKYLAEAGEETPVTAATCLDNPFDLEHAPNHPYFDQNLTRGLIDMLQSNKELFLGRSKGFNVEKALQAKSVKEFEEAISMVPYGFDSIEEFYLRSSTKDVVGNVQIPLLFIQNSAMSSSYIPRSLIAENPFTSLLNCTFKSDDKGTTRTSDVSWCQHLVVEWLTAVELGYLKGRHPILEDNVVTISPSKHIASQASSRNNYRQLDGNTSYLGRKMLKRNDEHINSSASLDLQMSKVEKEDTLNGMVTQTNLVDLKEGEGEVEVESERGKVVQATEVVMSLLDERMPEALSEEQKSKVLTAVSKGETLMNALQDAVPEDVRGKLTSSVTAILESQKKNLNPIPDRISSLTTKKQESSTGLSSVENDTKLNTAKNDALGDSNDGSQSQSVSNQGGETSNSSTHDQLGTDDASSKKNTSDSSDISGKVESSEGHSSDISGKVESSEGHVSDQVKLGGEGGTKDNQLKDSSESSTDVSTSPTTENASASSTETTKEHSESSKKEESSAQHLGVEGGTKDNKLKDSTESSTDVSTSPTTESASASSTEMTKEHSESPKKEESSVQPVPSSHSPSFSVSQAFDALTGMDDSTQLAVNSVFSVIEDVITQLEENRDNGSAVDDDKNSSTDSDSSESAVDDDNNSSTDSDSSESAAVSQKEGDGKSSMETEEQVSNHQETMHISTDKKYIANKNPENIQHSITRHPYRNSLYDHYFQTHLHSKMKNDKLLQPHAATALHLDFVPEDGQWKLVEQAGNGTLYADDVPSHERTLASDIDSNDDIIEPAYVILDGEGDSVYNKSKEKLENGNVASVQVLQVVKANILKALEVEVFRRTHATDMMDMLELELEEVADTISLAVVRHVISWDGEKLVEFGNLQGRPVLDAISSAVQGTRHMKEVIPVGIVVGSTLASLRKLVSIGSIGSTKALTYQTSDFQEEHNSEADEMAAVGKVNQNNLYSEDEGNDMSTSISSDAVMVGAVAALGASALLVHQQSSHSDGLESSTTSSLSFNHIENPQGPGKVEEETSTTSNMVTSFAEKAMSVAGPVMPTKEDGGVDQDRLVALLADLGQRGGILRLVGKVALLWGGIRGAMSLTGKLISFLRLAERPLIQRILGFVFMVLVLWTPVVVPLLPTLVQNWTVHNSANYAELACIVGLYGSIMTLIVLWGKRVRGYEDPLERYGLELTSVGQIPDYVYGLTGGVLLVLLIQYTNVLLGFVSLSWPAIPSSNDPVALLKLFGEVLRFVGQGLVTTTAIALVEELLFRSWLPEEIALDLGYHQGIILSGLAFSLSQWSLKAIPGVWLLSLGLAGVRHRCQGRLSLPIGLRAGIMASSYVLKEGGFLTCQQHNYPLWVSGGGDPFQPFNSVVGLAVAFLWATLLYPTNPPLKEHIKELRDAQI